MVFAPSAWLVVLTPHIMTAHVLVAMLCATTLRALIAIMSTISPPHIVRIVVLSASIIATMVIITKKAKARLWVTVKGVLFAENS